MRKSKQDLRFFVVVRLAAQVLLLTRLKEEGQISPHPIQCTCQAAAVLEQTGIYKIKE